MTDASSSASVDESLETLRRDRPAYGELVDFFGPLLRARERLAGELRADCPPPPPGYADARARGLPLLADNDLSAWSGQLERCAAELLPVLGGMLRIEDPAGRLRAHLERFDASLADLARLRLAGEESGLQRAAEDMNLPAPTLVFLLEQILGPVLGAVAAQLEEPETWGDGKLACPVCGSLPAFASLSRREPAHTEQIVGGGGRKYLHCGLCGHAWRVRRDACPGCGAADAAQRELLFAEGSPRERIEVCHACESYLLCIDLREYDVPPAPETVPLGLLHLDILAQGRELRPLVRSTWNALR